MMVNGNGIFGDDNQTVLVRGALDRVIYRNPQSGYTVMIVREMDTDKSVKVVGPAPEFSKGEYLEIEGAFGRNDKYGEQFVATVIRMYRPETHEAMVEYLASAINGVGPVLAARIVQKFGGDVWKILDETPERLAEVDGIKEGKLQEIIVSWKANKALKDILVAFHEYGVTINKAMKIYSVYGSDSLRVLRENPYELIETIWGFGFKTADGIATRSGLKRDDPKRLRAGLDYTFNELEDEGHCGYPRADVLEVASELLDVDGSLIAAALDVGIQEGRWIVDTLDGLIYSLEIHDAEVATARCLADLLHNRCAVKQEDFLVELAEAEAAFGMRLDEEQRTGLLTIMEQGCSVLTGGPGTGKTTLMNFAVHIMKHRGIKFELAAPTGRAAKRLAEVTSNEARTIHRMLEFSADTGQFQRDDKDPLTADIVIVDEVSMVDIRLMSSVVRAVKPGGRLVLVGDADQLPSVGPGKVLRDVIESGVVPTVRLQQIHRQAAESEIIMNAHAINRGEYPSHQPVDALQWADGRYDESTDFLVVTVEPDKVAPFIVQLVSCDIPKRFGLDALRDVHVIAPKKKGPMGVYELNRALREALNPGRSDLQWCEFRVSDKVMQLRNNYSKDVYNGDIGYVRSIDETNRRVVVTFGERDVSYLAEDLGEMMLAYAATIHKSQGGEYPCVVIALGMEHFVMLQRNLLYTAVTRGKQRVIIVGAPKAIGMAVKRVRAERRQTRLAERLRAGAADIGHQDVEISQLPGMNSGASLEQDREAYTRKYELPPVVCASRMVVASTVLDDEDIPE